MCPIWFCCFVHLICILAPQSPTRDSSEQNWCLRRTHYMSVDRAQQLSAGGTRHLSVGGTGHLSEMSLKYPFHTRFCRRVQDRNSWLYDSSDPYLVCHVWFSWVFVAFDFTHVWLFKRNTERPHTCKIWIYLVTWVQINLWPVEHFFPVCSTGQRFIK